MLKELEETEKNSFPFYIFLRIIFIILVICYMIYHFYNGEYGLRSFLNKQVIIDRKNITAKNLEKEINDVKNKINQLQDTNLDSDLLDEEIRKNTAYMKENEIVIYIDNTIEE